MQIPERRLMFNFQKFDPIYGFIIVVLGVFLLGLVLTNDDARMVFMLR
jgi:hypothetical protein